MKWTAALVLVASGICRAAEPAPNWKIAASYNTWSGAYGTDTRTTTTYLPLTLTRLFSDGDLGVTVPYLSVEGDKKVLIENGIPLPFPKRAAVADENTGASGLGDILLKGRYYLVDEKGWLPSIDVVARVKCPTASRSQGLGTGDFDESAGLETTHTLPRKTFLMIDAGYTLVGSPPGENLQDRWDYLLGLAHRFTKLLLASVNYEESRASLPGGTNPRDILVAGDFRVGRRVSLSASVLAGLSNGSPDTGFGLGGSVKF